MILHFENKDGREKKHGKQPLFTGTSNTLLPADSSTTGITNKYVIY